MYIASTRWVPTLIAVLAALAGGVIPAAAQTGAAAPLPGLVRPGPGDFTARIVDVFDQAVHANFPAGFRSVRQEEGLSRYLQEFVPDDQGREQWSQMMTVAGVKGLADNAAYTPARIAGEFQRQFQEACPDSYSGKTLSAGEVNGVERDVSVFGCGSHAITTGLVAETMLLMVFRGRHDYITLQWVERRAPQDLPPRLDLPAWIARYRDIGPVRLCARQATVPPDPGCS